jgi:hypothetical protein
MRNMNINDMSMPESDERMYGGAATGRPGGLRRTSRSGASGTPRRARCGPKA